MNIPVQSSLHSNEEGIQILLISSVKNWSPQELLEIFDMDKILQLFKNEWEKERIEDFPISINEIGANRIIYLWTEQA